MEDNMMGNLRAIVASGAIKPLTSTNTLQEFERRRLLFEDLTDSYRRFCRKDVGGAEGSDEWKEEVLRKRAEIDQCIAAYLGEDGFNVASKRMQALSTARLLKGSIRPFSFHYKDRGVAKPTVAAMNMPFVVQSLLAAGGISEGVDAWLSKLRENEGRRGRFFPVAEVVCAYNDALHDPRDGYRLTKDRGRDGYTQMASTWKHLKYSSHGYGGNAHMQGSVEYDEYRQNRVEWIKEIATDRPELFPLTMKLPDIKDRSQATFLAVSPVPYTSITGNHHGRYVNTETHLLFVRMMHSSCLSEYHPDFEVSSWMKPDVLIDMSQESIDVMMDSHPRGEWGGDDAYTGEGSMERVFYAAEHAKFVTVIYDHGGYFETVEGELFDVDPVKVGEPELCGTYFDLWE